MFWKKIKNCLGLLKFSCTCTFFCFSDNFKKMISFMKKIMIADKVSDGAQNLFDFGLGVV